MKETTSTAPQPPIPPHPPVPPTPQSTHTPAQPPKDFTDILGIISIIMIFVAFHLPGFIIGLIGARKAKSAGQSPVLSRIGWITNLVLMVLVVIGVALFLLLTFALANHTATTQGASTLFDASKSTSTETRTDSGPGFTLSVPANFTDLQEEYRNQDAIYSKGYDITNQYAMVIKEDAADFSDSFTVADYADLVNNEYPSRESLSNAVVTPLLGVANPHKLAVKDFEVTGDTSGVKVVFYIRYVKAGSSFYQVVTWTNPSKAKEAKSALTNILQSFNAV